MALSKPHPSISISSPSLSIKLFNPNFLNSNPNLSYQLKFLPKPLPNPSISIHASSSRLRVADPGVFADHPTSDTFSALEAIKPFLLSEWKPILYGWAFSAVSVYSLSKIVPKSGQFSAIVSDIGAVKREGLLLAAWFIVKLVANFLQHAFLWEAALNSAYRVRVHVFEKVLKRDLAFFESGKGVSAGDISYRITAEVEDAGDTMFALINVSGQRFDL